jgi:cytochrome c oxidase subunit 2
VRSNRRLRWVIVPLAAVIAVVLAGCSPQQLTGFLPTTPGTTNHVNEVIGLWNTSWLVLIGVGILTWGLIIWAAVVYRRRAGQTGLPVQLRYNLPIEIFYTVVPLILVLGFFAFTARDQTNIEQPFASKPDVQIDVYGKRWAWDFNYVNENVFTQGVQAQARIDKNLKISDTLPVLYLPVNKKVEITVQSRDVAHSFWIVNFLYKKDLIPGKTNYMYFIPEKIGTYQGKCAEMCGEYHADMLFQVKVVSDADYQAYIQSLAATGQNTGQVGADYNTNSNLPGNGAINNEQGAGK